MTSATHVPVMLERCVEILGPALERPARSSRRHSGAGRAQRGVPPALPQLRLIGLDRDPQALEPPAGGWPPLASARPGARGVRRDPRGAGAARRRGLRARVRPRSLLAPAGHARARLRLQLRRAAGHAHGLRRGITAEESSTPIRPPTSPASCAIRRGTFRAPDRLRIVAERERRNRSPPRPTGRSGAGRHSGGHPAHRRAPGQAHFQALRIEVNAELPVLERAIPAAVDAPGGRRPDRGARVPLAGGPAGQAGLREGLGIGGPARTAGGAGQYQP